MHQLIEAWRCKKCAGGLYVRHAVTTDIHVQITNHKFAAIPVGLRGQLSRDLLCLHD